MLRGKRALIALIVVLALVLAGVLTVRWLLRPDNLTRVISGWVQRELGAELTLEQSPGIRLIPQLQLGLEGARLERNGALLASASELRVALPWSTLWSGGFNIESLIIRRPVIAWPELMTLLAELSDPTAAASAPRLPNIAVGLRVEDGTLLSGIGEDDWRIDRLSMLTTPMASGAVFRLDAGARIRGSQSRTLSLSLRARTAETEDRLEFDDIHVRLVISPDNLPLADGVTIELSGALGIDGNGLAAADLAGQLPGWPDWLPDVLGFQTDQPIDLTLRSATDARLEVALEQGTHAVRASIDMKSLAAARALVDRPLAAIGALRSHWEIDALSIGDVEIEGFTLDIVEPVPAPAPAPAQDSEEASRDVDRSD